METKTNKQQKQKQKQKNIPQNSEKQRPFGKVKI